MNTKFMGGTSLARTEIEMQQIPGFTPRKSGMTVSRFSCTPVDCSKQHCKQKEKLGNECNVMGGFCQQERFVAGSVPFSTLLDKLSAEVGTRPFVSRVSRLSAKNVSLFDNDRHRSRFWKMWKAHNTGLDEAAMCAAVYLLSADAFLWGISLMAIRPDFIDFSSIQIHGVDLKGYVLFHTAKDLYQRNRHISLSELTDPELVSDEAFQLIIAAFLIRRYGVEVLYAERRDQ